MRTLCAQPVIRNVLIDHVRAGNAEKRDGGARRLDAAAALLAPRERSRTRDRIGASAAGIALDWNDPSPISDEIDWSKVAAPPEQPVPTC